MDEDVTNHDVVGESVLITLKEIFAYTAAARVQPVKLLWQGKEAGILNVEYQFEAKAPVEKKILIDGNVSVTVMTAALTRDLDTFTKMDPKCEMEFVNLEEFWEPEKYTSKAHEAGGKNPTWNEKFEARLRLDNTQLTAKSGVVFRVVDEDVKHHDIIGETAAISFNDLVAAIDKEKVVTLKLLFKN